MTTASIAGVGPIEYERRLQQLITVEGMSPAALGRILNEANPNWTGKITNLDVPELLPLLQGVSLPSVAGTRCRACLAQRGCTADSAADVSHKLSAWLASPASKTAKCVLEWRSARFV